MTSKDRIYSLFEMYLQSVKFVGVVNATKILGHYLRVKFMSRTFGDDYSFLGFKIKYINKKYLPDIFFEHFGNNTYFFKPKRHNPVILDLGANIGDSVLYFKWLYPNSKIYAFEPHPVAFSLLRDNIKINSLQDVKTYNIAIGGRSGKATLNSNDSEMFNGSSIKSNDIDSRNKSINQKFEVSVMPLSSHKDIVKLKTIDLLKIDVEGAEGEIFDNLDLILKKTQKVIIEYHAKLGVKVNSIDQIFDTLNKNGFAMIGWCYYRNSQGSFNDQVFMITGDKV